jgi:hypothetical protein
LEHYDEDALVRNCIRHSQRNPLALLVDPEDNELTGQGLAGNLRSIQLEPLDARRKNLLLQNTGRKASSDSVGGEKDNGGGKQRVSHSPSTDYCLDSKLAPSPSGCKYTDNRRKVKVLGQ